MLSKSQDYLGISEMENAKNNIQNKISRSSLDGQIMTVSFSYPKKKGGNSSLFPRYSQRVQAWNRDENKLAGFAQAVITSLWQ